jgi:hypothetical protein
MTVKYEYYYRWHRKAGTFVKQIQIESMQQQKKRVAVCPVTIVLLVHITRKMEMGLVWHPQLVQKFIVLVFVCHNLLTFLVGLPQESGHTTWPRTLDELKQRIEEEIRGILAEMLQRSMGNLNNRLEECIRRQGRHLQDVIFRNW